VKYVDTNIFIRYLTQDDPDKSAACLAFFNDVRDEKVEATTCEAVISEVVYVLASRISYQLPRADIRARVLPVLNLRGLKLPHRRVYLRALDLYVDHPSLDYEDALCVAHMEREEIQEIVSYDRDFDRLSDITRSEPTTPKSAESPNGASGSSSH
jgi:predicted nucleic acid-binding protein